MVRRKADQRPWRGDIATIEHDGEKIEGTVIARTSEAVSIRKGHERIAVPHEQVIDWESGGQRPSVRLKTAN